MGGRKNRSLKVVVCFLALTSLSLWGISNWVSHAAEGEAKGEECCKAGDMTPPAELVKKIPPGGLHSPYPDYAELAKKEELVKQFRLPVRVSGSGAIRMTCCSD
jgi:hypothetical protein